VDVESSQHILKSAFEALNVGVEFADVILESLDPAFLLGHVLAAFLFPLANKLRNIMGQPLVLHVVDVGEGGTDGGEDGGGEGSRMYRWPRWSMRYGGSVEEAGSSLDEMSFPRDGEEGGRVLLFIAVADVLSDRKEVRVAETVLVGGVGSVGDGIPFSRDVGGAGHLTGRLSHSLGSGVIFAVDVSAETRVLKGVFSFRGVDIGLGRPIEADSLSFDDLGVGRWVREDLVGRVEFERSQFTTFWVGERGLARDRRA